MIPTSRLYISAGLSVLPTNLSSKRPMLNNWRRLQQERLTDDECDRAFFGECNIAVICGAISGNLEVIDFDNKLNAMQPMFDAFKPCIDTFGLPYETTLSGGYHVFYRCDSPIEGNKKLAQVYESATERPCTIIETRGEGGYVVVAPSKGYKMIEGSIANIPTITKEQRDYIISTCKALNECEEAEYIAPESKGFYNYGVGELAGDKYNFDPTALKECRVLLERAGWRFVDKGMHVRRPGKTDAGFSATFGVMKSRAGVPLFHVFTPNGAPFEQDKSYNPFAVFTFLAHRRDFSESAKELNIRPEYEPSPVRKVTNHLPQFIEEELREIAKVETMVDEDEDEDEEIEEIEKVEAPMSKKNKEQEIAKAERFFTSHFNFRFDEVKHVVEWRPHGQHDWEVADENTLFRRLQHMGIKFKKEAIVSLLGSDYVPKFNPFDDFFRNLKKWDGVDHLTKLVSYLKVDDVEFFRKMLEKQFVRAIKCALDDTFYNRVVFVIRSREQEVGKSRLVQYFNPFPQQYFTDEFLKDDKDALIALTENFIYSLEELDDVGKQAGGLSKLKAVLAKRSVNVRLPYGRQKCLLYRRCTFFGTANRSEFLADDLNTRWLIFTVHHIDWKVFTEVNINDVWAQIFTLYRDDFYEWDLTDDEKIKREQMNLYHKQSVMEQEIIALNFVVSENIMQMSDLAKRMAYYAPTGARLNLDLSSIHDLLTTMGFKENSMVQMNTHVKGFYIEEKPRSWADKN